ncbi:MAG: PIN domain-containing protein, partial [Ruminococcus flavefaciens]|nr:PIN domain-containing protein [Ruminococcus flavefaciens]
MDNCCYNRLFDDRSNIKNYLEREAVLLIFELIYQKRVEITGSDILIKEMSAIKDVMKRERIHALYQNCVLKSVFADSEIIRRAKEIAKLVGTTSFDSLHLAISEKNAEVFLTTDIKLIKASKRIDLSVKVMNPIEFIMEVTENE